MADATTTLATLKEAVWRFADERAWHQFHSPKNLVMGLAVETAELMEHFLWVDCEASRLLVDDPQKRAAIAEELADVACHLFNLSNSLGIDMSDAMAAKMVKNALKYPVDKYRGKYEA
jgi:dCTP diphosphatase